MDALPTFEFAGGTHWGALFALLVMGVCALELGQSYKKEIRRRTTLWLGLICIFSLILNQVALLVDDPQLSWAEMLPLHYCSVMKVVCVLALWIPSRVIRSITYLGVLCACLQGLITPALKYDFPTLTYFAFFLSHGIMVIIALYLPIALGWKPARRDVLWALVFSNIYLIGALIVNLMLGTNYGFTMSVPDSGSVLNMLGPWPWYLIIMQIPGAVLMFALTLPFNRYPKGRRGLGLNE